MDLPQEMELFLLFFQEDNNFQSVISYISFTCMCAQLCLTLCNPGTVAHHLLLSMDFPRQECWSELPLPPPEDLPNPGLEPMSSAFLVLLIDSLLLSHRGSPSFT